MKDSPLFIWGLNIVLSAVVALSFTLYGFAFRQMGSMPLSSLADAARFGFAALTNPYFFLGLALALLGSVMRIGLMKYLGIARTALASEINLVMALVFTWLFFGEKLRFPRDYVGALFIFAGSYIVGK
jgi:drug/metabolite transporter (DMT)-like permease